MERGECKTISGIPAPIAREHGAKRVGGAFKRADRPWNRSPPRSEFKGPRDATGKGVFIAT